MLMDRPRTAEKQSNSDVVAALNKQLANWSVLFVKLHHYHWFVKGESFFTLHEKFEELYKEAAAYIDELAERVLMIGGRPLATMKEYAAAATIAEATGSETMEDMVRTTAQDFRQMLDELKQGITSAEQAGDESTVDLLIGIHSSLEKHVWMLSAFLE